MLKIPQDIEILGWCPAENVRTRKCILTAISGGVDISEVPGCHLF